MTTAQPRTRPPSGKIEDATLQVLFVQLGMYLMTLVPQDGQLPTLILTATMVVGNLLAAVLRNVLGAPFLMALGLQTKVAKGQLAKFGIVLMVAVSVGCASTPSVTVGDGGVQVSSLCLRTDQDNDWVRILAQLVNGVLLCPQPDAAE